MFLWSMRQYRDNLIKNGFEVYYHSIEDLDFKNNFEDKFHKTLKNEYFRSLTFLNHCGLIKYFFLQPFVPVHLKFGIDKLNL